MRCSGILLATAVLVAGIGGALYFDRAPAGIPVPMAKPDRAAPMGEQVVYRETGPASWYGPGFHGRETASGETFDQNRLTAAHRRLPLGSLVTVTNLENGRSIRVAINDRGPYVRGRVLDLSKAAARRLGMVDDGVVRVRIEVTRGQLAAAESRSNASVN